MRAARGRWQRLLIPSAAPALLLLLHRMPAISSEHRRRCTAAAACAVLVALPFLVIDFPPVTDLPQHLAQIRLFLEAIADPNGLYRIQWFTPYLLSFGLLGAAWAVVPPPAAGRVAVLCLVIAWTLAIHWLAARRRRPVAAAWLCSALVFNHVIYWGFLSFAVGWIAFIGWFLVTTRRDRAQFGWIDAAQYCGIAALLYASHVLWLLVAVSWLLLHSLLHRLPRHLIMRRLAAVAPVVLAALAWYPQLVRQGFVSPTVWFDSLGARLTSSWLVDAILGGLRGPAEPLIVVLLLTWIAASLWSRSGEAGHGWGIDRDFLGAGALLLLLGLVLPDQHMNTILFATRWMPAAMILLTLSVPAPAVVPRLHSALAAAVLAVFCSLTAAAWVRFERTELSGLHEALAALPANQRVIGLDFVKESPTIKGRPFLQTFAYAQVLHGGRLNFSFAGFAPSLVVFRQPPRRAWTRSLEWFAERVTEADLQQFDYALLNGADDLHTAMQASPQLHARTHSGRWRLYQTASPPVASPTADAAPVTADTSSAALAAR